MTNEQRADHFRRCCNAHEGEKDVHQNPSIARLIPRTQHAPNGTLAHRAHQEQNVIPCAWNHGELGSQWDLTQICIRLWSTCLHAADLPVEILNHELCSDGSLFHWVDRMKTDFTRTIVTLACSCAMGPIGSPGSNGSHLAVFKPIKRQNNYSGGCLEVVQGIPADMMWGFIVPILQNAVENADPHQAFDGRSWKTVLETAHVQAAFKGLMARFKKGVWSKTRMAEICRTQNAFYSNNPRVCKLRYEGLQFEFAMVLRKICPEATHPSSFELLTTATARTANVILTDNEWQQLLGRDLNDADGNPIPNLF